MRISKDGYLGALLRDEVVLNIYIYGSQVYGTATDASDIDFLVVVEDGASYLRFEDGYVDLVEDHDFHFMSRSDWDEESRLQTVKFMECYYLDETFKIKQSYPIKIEVDLVAIRRSFSSVSSNSYVKCRKKLEVVEDYNYYVGVKSLFHSLRILDFGIQVATGQGINYHSFTPYYDDIVNSGRGWDELKAQYKPIYNKLRSKFKQVAPLE